MFPSCSLDAVNQASSIQHMGVTCESITIGHNNFALPLAANHIVIPAHGRPKFLSEKFLRSKLDKGVSPAGIIGLFAALKRPTDRTDGDEHTAMESLLAKKNSSRNRVSKVSKNFSSNSLNNPNNSGSGLKLNNSGSSQDLQQINSGSSLVLSDAAGSVFKTQIQDYFGAELQKEYPKDTKMMLMERQKLSQRLYESRIASLQRCVSFFVMFHHMAKKVQGFWPKVSFGLLHYDMDRTQSIMRIATTASPVSGMDVREKILQLSLDRKRHKIFDNCRRMARQWREKTREGVLKRFREKRESSSSPQLTALLL